jgi:hypothetical protein
MRLWTTSAGQWGEKASRPPMSRDRHKGSHTAVAVDATEAMQGRFGCGPGANTGQCAKVWERRHPRIKPEPCDTELRMPGGERCR